MAKMFPYHHLVHVEEPDYGPGFVEAASLVETACAGFHAAAGLSPGALAADAGERGLVVGADAPGVDLAEGPTATASAIWGPCLSFGMKVHSGKATPGSRLDLEHDGLALLPAQATTA
jgi:hypothetical protein